MSALAFVGCAGSGTDGGGGGGGTSGGSGRSVASVNLPNTPGLVSLGFLTGQGRAVGDTFAVVRRFELRDDYGLAEDPLSSTRRLLLQGYEFQLKPLNVRFTGQPSRKFNSYTLDITHIEVDSGGGISQIPVPTSVPAGWPSNFSTLPAEFPSRITAFPGRQTLVPIFLDDSMIREHDEPADDPDLGSAWVFDKGQFETINLPAEDPRLLGFLSDYVRFDISNLAARPLLSTGADASYVFFSGDGYGISESGNQGLFEALTLDEFTPNEGRFKSPAILGGTRTPGTYTLIQPNPSDLSGLARVTSLQGIWRDASEVISGLGEFEVISFPGSDDGPKQDVVAIVRTGGVITDFYFGELDVENGTIRIYPLENIVGASTAGEITGTVSGFLNKTGAATTLPNHVREGSYSLTGDLPTGFQATGRFIVFRR